MNAKTLILAILNQQEASGYEIKKLSTEDRFSHFVDISFGSIYPTLARLETEHLVTCRSETQSGKPDRKIYSITDKGRVELVQALSQPPQPDKFKSEFLLVAMNASLIGETAIARAVEDRVAWLEAKLNMLGEIKADCGHPATSWVVSYGISVMEDDLTYLKKHKHELLKLAKAPIHTEAAE